MAVEAAPVTAAELRALKAEIERRMRRVGDGRRRQAAHGGDSRKARRRCAGIPSQTMCSDPSPSWC